MITLKIDLSTQAEEKLRDLARRERRSLTDQAIVLIEKALRVPAVDYPRSSDTSNHPDHWVK